MKNKKQELLEQFMITSAKISRILNKMSTVSIEDKIATMLHMQALMFLKERPQSTVGELASELHMSSSSIAQFTDRLVAAGLVARKSDRIDRRIVRLIITSKGEIELTRIHKKIIEKLNMITPYISEVDLREMYRINTNILKKLEEKITLRYSLRALKNLH